MIVIKKPYVFTSFLVYSYAVKPFRGLVVSWFLQQSLFFMCIGWAWQHTLDIHVCLSWTIHSFIFIEVASFLFKSQRKNFYPLGLRLKYILVANKINFLHDRFKPFLAKSKKIWQLNWKFVQRKLSQKKKNSLKFSSASCGAHNIKYIWEFTYEFRSKNTGSSCSHYCRTFRLNLEKRLKKRKLAVFQLNPFAEDLSFLESHYRVWGLFWKKRWILVSLWAPNWASQRTLQGGKYG